MASESSSGSSGGIGLFGAMFLLFLGLKLGGVIDWSWWCVTAPLWGPAAVGLAALAFFFLVIVVCEGSK